MNTAVHHEPLDEQLREAIWKLKRPLKTAGIVMTVSSRAICCQLVFKITVDSGHTERVKQMSQFYMITLYAPAIEQKQTEFCAGAFL